MGVPITTFFSKEPISLDDLNGKTLAVDTHIFLYQFLTTIRQRDGTPLMDSKGNVTSHLTGLFNRTCKLLQKNIKPIYVFDGKPPKLKQAEREKRKRLKQEAEEKYKIAKKKKDIIEMKKYASRTTRLTPEIISESKKLIEAFGLPVIQAPSEGEAQAAFIVKQKEAFAVASQDADSLLFGTPNLIRNISVVGKKKRRGQLNYETIQPELVNLKKTLNNLGINQNQLIILGILVGTDYNPGGIKGIGPKNALTFVKEYKNNFNGLFKKVKWGDFYDIEWEEIFNLFKEIPINKDYSITFSEINQEKIKKILVDDHDFSQERIEKSLQQLLKQTKKKKQKGLGEWF